MIAPEFAAQLAQEQHRAMLARHTPTWVAFVRKAEVETGIPWKELRDILDPYVQLLYATTSNQEHSPASTPEAT